jgi:hypothetical protein
MPGPWRKRLPFILAGAGVVTCAVVILLITRKPGDPLTAERLRAAHDLWIRRAIQDYDLDVEVSGTQKGSHHIEVRAGRVAKMTTGGAPVPESAWEYWGVDGMFRFLEGELQNADRPEIGFGVKNRSDVVLYAHFDPDYGFPRHYFRHVMGRRIQIRWEITGFRELR